MRENGKAQNSSTPRSLSSSGGSSATAMTDENRVIENVSSIPLKKKEMKPSSVRGASRSPGGSRPALRALQTNKLDSRVLVGQKSPSVATVTKEKQLKQSVISWPSILSSRKQSEEVKVKTTEQSTQTHSLDYRMITEEDPPPEYWKILAEKRRVALAETLKENEGLYTMVSGLEKRVKELEVESSDLQYFAMMYALASKDNELAIKGQ